MGKNIQVITGGKACLKSKVLNLLLKTPSEGNQIDLWGQTVQEARGNCREGLVSDKVRQSICYISLQIKYKFSYNTLKIWQSICLHMQGV